jgi:hypothetical protein
MNLRGDILKYPVQTTLEPKISHNLMPPDTEVGKFLCILYSECRVKKSAS